ncbi:hypothetical protein BKG69_13105 [Mycobacteroides chelonae]|uniref:TetR/AcrR family transcriptional regulator n=1 Tax=Mycobacteroides chelonae TaxID=1774 RepID=UPI0008A98A69|nr:TetR/AcrR family transcriptional regulator [Mycobacteroides chelonae]OHT79325.1 hypothetical protein BKG69_13105 [Mycobacteroides chelonae]
MPVDDPWSRWAGVPIAERSRQRRELILQAAFDLVAEGGLGEVTIRAVSRRSGIHRRYFGESFDSREALLCAMFDTAAVNMTVTGMDKLKSSAVADTDGRLRIVIHSGLSFIVDNPAQAEVLFAALDEPALRGRWQESMASFRLLISRQAHTGGQLQVRDAIIVAFLEGAVVEFGKRWKAGELGSDVETATDVSATAVLELMKLNESLAGADERAAALWKTVMPQ